MNKQELINAICDRCREPHIGKISYRPAMTKTDVAAVLHFLPEVILKTLLQADKVNLPGLGQFHAAWLPKSGPKQLYAQFDWDKGVEQRLLEAKP